MRPSLLFLAALLLGFTLTAQSLAVKGDVPYAKQFTLSDLESLGVETVTVKDDTYSGVPVWKVLKAVGQPTGAEIKGTQVARYLLIESNDAYRVILSIPEVDPAFRDTKTLIAWKKNGKPLDAAEGPLRLLIEGDKRQTRWAKRVVSLTIVWPQTESAR